MNKARIRELKEILGQAFRSYSRDWGSANLEGHDVDALRDITALIDAALAESDADVAEAIDTFRSFIINRHDADWVGDTVSNQYLCDSVQIALRQMGSTEPCEWCELAENCEYEVTYFEDDNRWAINRSLMPKYCPNCGRPLKGGE